MKFSRREFLVDSLAAAAAGAVGGCATCGNAVGCTYPGWKPGEMDIHFIHTGTSENTFFIFPDGTTMLLDCGHVKKRRPGYAEALPPMPSGRRRAGEWVRRYIERLIPQREIDYLMVSHWHSDHFAGIPDVAESFRFLNYYDHQYPNVGKYRRDVDDADFDVFQKWLESAVKAGMKREPFKVGAKDQIRLQHDPTGYYRRVFEIRNLAANGVMWDGKKDLIDVAGEHVKQTGQKHINENPLSAAIRIRYGDFTYFTGGDLEGDFVGADGKKFSYEERVGDVVGPVPVERVESEPAERRDAHADDVARELRRRAFRGLRRHPGFQDAPVREAGPHPLPYAAGTRGREGRSGRIRLQALHAFGGRRVDAHRGRVRLYLLMRPRYSPGGSQLVATAQTGRVALLRDRANRKSGFGTKSI